MAFCVSHPCHEQSVYRSLQVMTFAGSDMGRLSEWEYSSPRREPRGTPFPCLGHVRVDERPITKSALLQRWTVDASGRARSGLCQWCPSGGLGSSCGPSQSIKRGLSLTEVARLGERAGLTRLEEMRVRFIVYQLSRLVGVFTGPRDSCMKAGLCWTSPEGSLNTPTSNIETEVNHQAEIPPQGVVHRFQAWWSVQCGPWEEDDHVCRDHLGEELK